MAKQLATPVTTVLGLMLKILQKRVLTVVVLSATLFTIGCAIRSDLRPGTQYPSDYVIGAVYRTKVVLIAQRANWFHYPLLQKRFNVLDIRPPDRFTTIADVEAGTKPYMKNFVVIPQGTLIRFERFVDQTTPVGRAIFACGRILKGPFANEEATLNGISDPDPWSNPFLYKVDPKFLEMADSQ